MAHEPATPGWWRRLFDVQRREAERVKSELATVRDLVPLLMKVRNGGSWTPEEKLEIVAHMRRMAHLSPYLLAMILPGSVILLPIYAWWLDRRRHAREDGRAVNSG